MVQDIVQLGTTQILLTSFAQSRRSIISSFVQKIDAIKKERNPSLHIPVG